MANQQPIDWREIVPRPIIVRFDDSAGQWVAHFEGKPEVAFGGEFSTEAAQRLLEATTPLDWEVTVRIQQVDGTESVRKMVWQVPDLLVRVPCPSCNGTGKYIGLTTQGPCETCWGIREISIAAGE